MAVAYTDEFVAMPLVDSQQRSVRGKANDAQCDDAFAQISNQLPLVVFVDSRVSSVAIDDREAKKHSTSPSPIVFCQVNLLFALATAREVIVILFFFFLVFD